MTTPSAFTVAQLAERWQVSTGQIYALVRRGDLRSFPLGTLIRISADEVARVEGLPVGKSLREVESNKVIVF